LNGASVAA
jgi:hypothetical protein